MKKFLFINLFIICFVSAYSEQDITNLNDLLKKSGSFSNSKTEKPKIEAKIDNIEATSIKNNDKDLFTKSEKHYTDQVLIDLNNLLKEKKDFSTIALYIDKNIKNSNEAVADEMILLYENYFYSIPLDTEIFIADEELLDKKYAVLINEEIKKYNNNYSTLIKNYANVENSELSSYLKSLYDKNLSLIYNNGYFFFTVNYNKLASYSEYLSKPMLAYLTYSDTEINKPAVVNSKIVIPMNEMVDRILLAETSINSDNKDLNKEFAKMLVFHFENFVLGVGNDPIFNFETNEINKEFLDAYKYYISKDGIFKSDFQNFLNSLEKNNYLKSKLTYNEQLKITNKIINYYQLKREETFQ